jgi:hypothetical protein
MPCLAMSPAAGIVGVASCTAAKAHIWPALADVCACCCVAMVRMLSLRPPQPPFLPRTCAHACAAHAPTLAACGSDAAALWECSAPCLIRVSCAVQMLRTCRDSAPKSSQCCCCCCHMSILQRVLFPCVAQVSVGWRQPLQYSSLCTSACMYSMGRRCCPHRCRCAPPECHMITPTDPR